MVKMRTMIDDPFINGDSHTIPISLGILMGLVWEAYHKGVPLLGVPENPTDLKWVLLLILTTKNGGRKDAMDEDPSVL